MSPVAPIWLDCDPGHDDAFAILLAGSHPSLNLLGVSTVHGNASLPRTTHNALSILKAIGREDVPVYSGAAKPFCRAAVHAPDIHGISGIDGTDLLPTPTRAPETKFAVQAMAESVLAQPPKTAWIVATGALTNVALAFATYPQLAEHVRGVNIMGGSIGNSFTDAPLGQVGGERERFGNTTPYAEFNIYCDPESAHSLLSNPVLAPKTTLIPLDLTHLVLATSDVKQRLLGSPDPSILRRMLHDLLNFFAATYDKVYGISAGPPLHDPLAVAVALEALANDAHGGAQTSSSTGFDDKREERFVVGVVTDGRHVGDLKDGGSGTVSGRGDVGQVGRTLANLVEGEGVRIPRGVSLEWFWGEILGAVKRAERVSKE